jgi:hypothetical protein
VRAKPLKKKKNGFLGHPGEFMAFRAIYGVLVLTQNLLHAPSLSPTLQSTPDSGSGLLIPSLTQPPSSIPSSSSPSCISDPAVNNWRLGLEGAWLDAFGGFDVTGILGPTFGAAWTPLPGGFGCPCEQPCSRILTWRSTGRVQARWSGVR